MKKLLSIVLALSMIATMLVFALPVNATEIGGVDTGYTPSGTAINSADDFANMTANGSYYLNADITISASWNNKATVSANAGDNNAFSGTLDGNGHKITTTVPVFAFLAGTVKNLTIEGNVANSGIADSGVTFNAALAVYGSGNIVIENVYNKASVAKADAVGGLIAWVDTYPSGSLVMKNCRNDADLASNRRTGGMVCYVTGGYVSIEDCVNNGDMYASTGTQYTYVSGIIAQSGKASEPYPVAETSWCSVRNCVNNGKISADRGYTAGIAAFSYGHVEIFDSVNNGLIENVINADGKAAGIYVCPTTRESYCSIYIKGCVNNATIKGAFHAAGIITHLGYNSAESSTFNYTVKNCANFGDIYLNPNKIKPSSSYMRIGGIVAYAFGGATSNSVTGCINAGNLIVDMTKAPSKKPHVGGVVGYVNGNAYTFKNNINVGTITIVGADASSVSVGMLVYNSTDKSSLSNTSNNYTIDGGDIPTIRYAGTLTSTNATVITAEQVASGELAYLANAGAGADLFFQKIGTDAVPTVVPDGTNMVDIEGENTYTNLEQSPEIDTSGDPVRPGAPDSPDAPEVPVDQIPTPNFPKASVTKPDAGNVGKVDANYKPEGTAVTNAAEFAAMVPNGNYYLANDITITATWNAGKAVSSNNSENIAFTGIFDGNGNKITTDVALFANLGGTVKNLTIEGAIKATATHNAALAIRTVFAEVFIDNVYNKANVLGGKVCGSLIAYATDESDIRITSCRNDGNITGDSYLGGIIGFSEDKIVHIKDTVNCGNITSTKGTSDSYGAGIIGHFGGDAAVGLSSICKLENCANYGDVSAVTGYSAGMLAFVKGYANIISCTNYGNIVNGAGLAAGILGSCSGTKDTTAMHVDGAKNYGNIASGQGAGGIVAKLGASTVEDYYVYKLQRSENHGDVYVIAYSGTAATIYVGGIAGYAYGGESKNTLSYNVNTGDVHIDTTKTSKTSYVAGILGYVNGAVFVMKNNINAGTVNVTGNVSAATLVMYNKASGLSATAGNFTLACGNIAKANVASSTTVDDGLVKVVSADQLASGEITCAINQGLKENIAFQNLGQDKTPVFDNTHLEVIKNDDGTYANKEKPVVTPPTVEDTTTAPSDEVTTEAPADTTTESTTNEKSCGGFAFAAQIVTILGAAITVVVFKKN